MLSKADPSVSGVNATDEEGWAPLHSAVSIGNAEIVDILLDRGEMCLITKYIKQSICRNDL